VPLPAPRVPELEIDHVQAAIDALPIALRTPLILAIVRVFAARWQAIWDVQGAILGAFDLTDPASEAWPPALRVWGDALGVQWRKAWPASTYRRVLLGARLARGSTGSREEILAVASALTPTGAPPPTVQAAPLTVWVHAPGITDPDEQEALRALLLLAIPDVADLALDFAGEDVLKFDTPGAGLDQAPFA